MRAGEVIAGRFEIERLAGAGGMGSVFRARDRAEGGRTVALKVLHGVGEGVMERFDREGRILAELRHPSIVQYVAHGRSEDGPWLAIEWLEGEDLHQRLSRDRLTIRESLDLVAAIASPLEVAHARGIVHRDLKPSNVFLVDKKIDRVKLLDFGVARLTAAMTVQTRTGMLIGTPGYMAPEQARGARHIDARADVFALGCVLFECITGRAAFVGDHAMAVLAKILLQGSPRASDVRPDVPAPIDDLVANLLAKEAEQRPADASALLRRLDEIRKQASFDDLRPLTRRTGSPEPMLAEQRLLGVILAWVAGAPLDEPNDRTLTPAELSAPVDGLRKTLGAYGAQLEALADGSLAATLARVGSATDHAVQVARCALALRAASPEAVIAVAIGRGHLDGGWPVGEVIDVAAARMRDGSRGTISIDETTAALLGDRFVIEGDAKRGRVLVGEHAVRQDVRKLLGQPTPCVGRDRELRTLEAILRECVEESVPRAVLVTAAAGMGKSRLRHELLRRVAQRDPSEPHVEVWLARGDPMSAGSPFGMVAPAIRRAAGMQDGEPLEIRQQKLRARVARHVPAEDAYRVTEFLGELLGVPFRDDPSLQLRAALQNPTLMGDQMRAAWEAFLDAECAQHPVMLVLEDLHWGDVPTVKYLDSALRNLKDRPLMVLALAREEVHQLFPKLWAGRSLTQVQLGELSRKACERLVRQVLGEAFPAEKVEAIIDRATGNAFYLEELIRAVHQDAEAKSDRLPETVLAMVQVRLEGLDPEWRRVLRAASVFGKAFWRGGLSALLGGEERAAPLLECLPKLQEHELIETRPARFPGEEEYFFRHGLVRDGAYAMLTAEDRALGHRHAGVWLEAKGESDAIVLAQHFHRGDEPRRALRWFSRGAEQALEGNDFAAAVQRAELGIACGAKGEALGMLRLVQAEAHRWRGELSDVLEGATEATTHLVRGSAPWFRAVEEAMTVSARQGNYPGAFGWGDLAKRTPPVGEDQALHAARSARVVALCGDARIRFEAGQYEEADERIADLADMVGPDGVPVDPRAMAEFARVRGARARHVGALGADFANYEAALALFIEAGDARSVCNTRVSLAFALLQLGAHARAESELNRGLALAERMGLSTVALRARHNLGLVLSARGKVNEARTMEQEAIDAGATQGNRRFEGWSRMYLSMIELRGGDVAASEREARLAAELLTMTPPARAGALAALALSLLEQGRAEEATAPAREAMDILAPLEGLEQVEAMVRLAFVETMHRTGKPAEAKEAIGKARARLLARAAEIADPSLRKAFLEQVHENARTLKLASEWFAS